MFELWFIRGYMLIGVVLSVWRLMQKML